MLRGNPARHGLILFFMLALGCSLSTKGTLPPAEDGRQDPDAADADLDVRPDEGGDGEVEIPPGCGDGEIGAGEQCDDGNEVPGDGCEPDCSFTCEENADCADADMCNGAETCTSLHTCDPGTELPDGNVCPGDPRSICLGGACAESRCGDGFLDAGNGETCEPALDVNCREDCTLACDGDEDCPSDGNDCNGSEFCNTAASICASRSPLPDGTPCGTDPLVRSICIAGTCSVSACGDGYVDGGATPPEACDDRNLVGGDGCEADCTWTCLLDDDCADADVCNGIETCNLSTHTCLAGANALDGVPCDDGIFCNGLDTCDGAGGCEHPGNPCVDALACTDDTCTTTTCPHGVLSGWCLIAGACVAEGTANPGNECEACMSSASQTAWSRKTDMNLCTGGRCCSGVCVPGALCCTNLDCPMACKGRAVPCRTFPNAATCAGQAGCTWSRSTAGCTGRLECSDIDAVPTGYCMSVCGCSGSSCTGSECWCSGTSSVPCSNLTGSGETSCTICGCVWGAGIEECWGHATTCPTFTTEPACLGQSGCGWETQVCLPYFYYCF
jgi:cysteine-rich repeat protein